MQTLHRSDPSLIRQDCRVLIDSIQRVKSSEESYSNEVVAQHVKDPIYRWATSYKDILQSFLNWAFDEIKNLMIFEDLEAPEWARNAMSQNRSAKKNEKIHPNYSHHHPFVDPKITDEKRRTRFMWLVSKVTGGAIDSNGFQEIVDDCFDSFFDGGERSKIFRLKGAHHLFELKSSRNDHLYDTIDTFINPPDIDRLIINDSSMMISLHTLYDTGQNNRDFAEVVENISSEITNLKYSMSTSAIGTSSHQILDKLDSMDWGPSNFQRNSDVIDEAKSKLLREGALSITAWGGSGKTALANKMVQDFASSHAFSKYLLFTTKLTTQQGEIRFGDGGVQHTETDLGSSVYSPLTVESGFRRVCIQIVRTTEEVTSMSIEESTNEQMLGRALDALNKDKILVVLDNFEDIEKAYDQNENEQNADTIEHQYMWFKKLVDTHHDNKRDGKSKSCILITTRGEANLGEPFPLPMLNYGENFDLFKAVIFHRIRKNFLPESIHAVVAQNLSKSIEQEFAKWTSERGPSQNKSNEWKIFDENSEQSANTFHPLHTQGAAWTVKNEYNVLESIRMWNPREREGGPRKVAEYCTSMMLEATDDREEVALIKESTKKPMNYEFENMDFGKIARDLGFKGWNWQRCAQFSRKYHQDRRWLEKHQHKTRYRWTYNFYTHLVGTGNESRSIEHGESEDNWERRDILVHDEARRIIQDSVSVSIGGISKIGPSLEKSLAKITKERNIPMIKYNELIWLFFREDDLIQINHKDIPGWRYDYPPKRDFVGLLIQLKKGSMRRKQTPTSDAASAGTKGNLEAGYVITESGKLLKKLTLCFKNIVQMLLDSEYTGPVQIRKMSKRLYELHLAKILSKEEYLELIEGLIRATISPNRYTADSQFYDMLVVHDLLPKALDMIEPIPITIESETLKMKHPRLYGLCIKLYETIWDYQNHDQKLSAQLFWLCMTLFVNNHVDHSKVQPLLRRFESAGSRYASMQNDEEEVNEFITKLYFRHGELDVLDLSKAEEYCRQEKDSIVNFGKGRKQDLVDCKRNIMLSKERRILSLDDETYIYFKITNFTGSILHIEPLVYDGVVLLPLRERLYSPPLESQEGQMNSDEEIEQIKILLIALKSNKKTWPHFCQISRDSGISSVGLLKRIESLSDEMQFIVMRPPESYHDSWIDWLDVN